MKCLRCGHCCKNYMVTIVDDPELGVSEENLIFHEGNGNPCPHLKGDTPGEYFCAIHDYPWYEEIPCYFHGQIEQEDSECRLGRWVMDQENKKNDK